jgi:hypothetical protein
LVKAGDVADTLRLLIPGFVALKAFYLLGLRTRRSDAEWVLWSVLMSVPLTGVASVLHSLDDNERMGIAMGLGMLAGGGAGHTYTLLSRSDRWIRPLVAVRAWDAAVAQDRWMQFWLKNQSVWLGRPYWVASSAETEDLDIYLANVQAVDPDTGARTPVPVAGLLLSRSEIELSAVFNE